MKNGATNPCADEVFVLPTTVAQRGFWFLDQVQPGNAAFNIAVRFRLQGILDVQALTRALNEIVARHEVLRTVFRAHFGEPVQVISPALSLSLPVTDLRSLPPAERARRREVLTDAEAQRPFDLATGPLLRAELLQLADDEHDLLLTVHHIVSDGWSIGVIVAEIGALYDALARGRTPALAALPLQYGDYAIWEEQWHQSGALAEQLLYWKRRLAQLPHTEVPTDRPRPAIATCHGRIESILLPKDLTASLEAWSNRQGATFFMVALAALKVLLQRHAGHDDITVGSPVAGRSRVEIEPLVGVFINSLVLRTNLAGDPSFAELVSRVRDTVLEAFAHQEAPFERVVEAVMPKRDLARHPLFQVNFIYQRDFVRPQQMAGVTLTAIPSRSPGAIYDLNFFMVEREEGWRASCEYNTDLYDATTVNLMLAQFHTLLECVAAEPDKAISAIPVISADEFARQDAHPAAIDRTLVPDRVYAPPAAAAADPQLAAPADELEGELCALWAELLNVAQVGPTTDFFEAGGHSLLAAKLLARVEQSHGRKLAIASFLQVPTVRAMAERLRTAPEVAIGDQVLPIQPTGSRTPLFILTSQSPQFYRAMAAHLGTEQPVLGLYWPELSQLRHGFTIDDLVSNVIAVLKSVQPRGPYYLGGWCMSGVVIYEVARQLRAAGDDVALVALFDANSPAYVRSFEGWRALPVRVYFHGQRMAHKLAKAWRMGLARAIPLLCRQLVGAVGERFSPFRPALEEAADGELPGTVEVQSNVAGQYEPRPYQGTVLLFRSAAMQRGPFRDPTLGWERVVGSGLSTCEIPGEHHEMFLEPAVALVAQALAAHLPRD